MKTKATIIYQWFFTTSDGLQKVIGVIYVYQVKSLWIYKIIDNECRIKHKYISVSISATIESLATSLLISSLYHPLQLCYAYKF